MISKEIMEGKFPKINRDRQFSRPEVVDMIIKQYDKERAHNGFK